jgi:acyl-CoA thioesterase
LRNESRGLDYSDDEHLASFVTRALMAASPLPTPLALNVHFLVRATAGPATVEIDILRAGRSHVAMSARLVQTELVAAALATFGIRQPGCPELGTLAMPSVPAPDACAPRTAAPPPGATIGHRFERRLPPNGDPTLGGAGHSSPTAGGWTRMVDRDLDDLAVPVFMDSWPASIWGATGRSPGAPTIELSVHWWATPRPGWHLAWFHTVHAADGYFVEDGALWSTEGTLVAQSRQLARFIPNAPR